MIRIELELSAALDDHDVLSLAVEIASAVNDRVERIHVHRITVEEADA